MYPHHPYMLLLLEMVLPLSQFVELQMFCKENFKRICNRVFPFEWFEALGFCWLHPRRHSVVVVKAFPRFVIISIGPLKSKTLVDVTNMSWGFQNTLRPWCTELGELRTSMDQSTDLMEDSFWCSYNNYYPSEENNNSGSRLDSSASFIWETWEEEIGKTVELHLLGWDVGNVPALMSYDHLPSSSSMFSGPPPSSSPVKAN